jgi:hypothetical protein
MQVEQTEIKKIEKTQVRKSKGLISNVEYILNVE